MSGRGQSTAESVWVAGWVTKLSRNLELYCPLPRELDHFQPRANSNPQRCQLPEPNRLGHPASVASTLTPQPVTPFHSTSSMSQARR
jgi:hypothetical protein